MEVIDLLKDGAVWSREELVFFTEKDDRAVREDIHSLRRRGIPVMGLKSGGYKLATTDIEKQEMLHQLKGRALDLLKTYSVMTKAMQVEGQMSLEELLMSALVINTADDTDGGVRIV